MKIGRKTGKIQRGKPTEVGKNRGQRQTRKNKKKKKDSREEKTEGERQGGNDR